MSGSSELWPSAIHPRDLQQGSKNFHACDRIVQVINGINGPYQIKTCTRQWRLQQVGLHNQRC
jgi:hypothetical protein